MNSPTLNMIASTLKENKRLWVTLIFVIGMAVCLALIPAQLIRILIDQYLIPQKSAGIEMIAMVYVLTLILTGSVDFMKGYCLTVYGSKLATKLRLEMSKKTKRLQPYYFKNNSPAQTSSRFINDVDSLNALFKEGVISMLIDLLKIIGICISVTIFAWQLGIIAFLLIPLIYGITHFFQKRMLKAQIENLNQLSKVNQHINESLKTMKMMKIFHKESYMEDAYSQCLSDNYQTKESVNFYDSLYAPLIQIIRALTIILIFIAVFNDMEYFAISVGKLAASIELISSLLSPIESLGMEISNIQKGISGMNRLDEFFNESDEEPKIWDINQHTHFDSITSIEFHHVSFAYHEQQDVIHDLHLQITPGTNTTFTGRTGAGKSTLFNLILGLYQPQRGAIRLNGVDVSTIPHSFKRKIFGYVEQQFQFIQGSIISQITLNDPAVSKEDVIRACELVGLHETIVSMENGYDSLIITKEEFSQGQKQLLSIARAIVSNPSILLLDEITANLDSATEAKINDVLRNVIQGRTIFSITHRLSSLLENERIIQL